MTTKRSKTNRDSSHHEPPSEQRPRSLRAKFYATLYLFLPDWISYKMRSSGVPDTKYWGEPGKRRLAGSTSHGVSPL